MKNSVVVTGASGMLGRAIMGEIAALNPVGTALTRINHKIEQLDLRDVRSTRNFFMARQPRVIIHTAAERRPDVSQKDPEGTRALNVDSTRHLATLAKELGAWLLYTSTDYVFDGTTPPYKPGDKTNPLNLYGVTKLDGEIAVQAEAQDAGILRLGVLFGRVEYPEESAVTAVIKDIRSTRPSMVDHWGQRYPTYVGDVAFICRKMVEQSLGGRRASGVWHWCGGEMLTKYDQARVIGEVLGMSTDHLTPDSNQPGGAPRPRDCRLDCSGVENSGFSKRTPFRVAIEQSLRGANF